MDKELEQILQRRYVPEPSSNLAERIITAAALEDKKRAAQAAGGVAGFGAFIGKIGAEAQDWFGSFWDGLLLPKPAYVTMALFMLGLLLGIYTDYAEAAPWIDTAQASMVDLIYTAENVSEGDWL
ncbi:MAG: hypothetical protein ACK4VI_05855 [Alphaproteobacteria bacterium]